MKSIKTAAILLLSVAAISACDDDDDPIGITFSDLVGSWSAQSFVYASADNPALAIDVIGTLNGDLDLTVASNQTFTGTVNVPNLTPGPLPIGGSLALDTGTGTVSVDFDAQTESYDLFEDFTADYQMSSDRNTLTWTYEGTTFDFDQDGDEEDAVVTVVLIRQ